MSFRHVSGIIFLIVAFAHATRAVMHVPIQIVSHSVSIGLSWIGSVVAAALAVWAFRSR